MTCACRICGRQLRDPVSVARQAGPVCLPLPRQPRRVAAEQEGFAWCPVSVSNESARFEQVERATVARHAQLADPRQLVLGKVLEFTVQPELIHGANGSFSASMESAVDEMLSDPTRGLVEACNDFMRRTGREARIVLVSLAREKRIVEWANRQPMMKPVEGLTVPGTPVMILGAWVVGANIADNMVQPVWCE